MTTMTDAEIRNCYHKIRNIELGDPKLRHRTYWDTCKFIAFVSEISFERIHRVCIDEE